MLPVHIEVWMRGKRFEQQLEPFQKLVFQWHSVFAGHMNSKSDMERALHTFRHTYYNKFLFENQTPDAHVQAWKKRLKEFDELKKPSKKDFTALYKDLCGYKSCEWIGGHNGGMPVLAQWKANLLQCPPIYKDWYRDEVEELQKPFETNKCAVTGAKFTWKTPDVPAAARIFSEHCEPTEQVQNAMRALEQYIVVPRSEITHVTKTFLDMYTEMATDAETPFKEQLHDLYKKRLPGGYDAVSAKKALQARAKQLERDLEDAEARANSNNALYKECSLSLDNILKRLSDMERTLNQYQSALRERDEIIRRMSQSNQGIYNHSYY